MLRKKNKSISSLNDGVSTNISIGQKAITFNDVKTFDVDVLTEEEINDVKVLVYQKYKKFGGNGRVAKSSTFVNEVDASIGI